MQTGNTDMQGKAQPRPTLTPAFLASIWGYLVLLVAWYLANEPVLSNYLQLAIPFTVPFLVALSTSNLYRVVLLWIAAGGTSLVMVVFAFSGLWILLMPVMATYLWTAWRLIETRKETLDEDIS